MNYKKTLKLIAVCLLCGIIFFGSGYFYLSKNMKSVSEKAESVPYEPARPENCGVLLDMPEDRLLIYLNFEDNSIFCIYPPDNDTLKVGDSYHGYEITYTVKCGNDTIEQMIDCIDGIDMTVSGETLRYTGVQICQLINDTDNLEIYKRDIMKACFQKIADTGFSKDFIKKLVQNTDTNLTIPQCRQWDQFMPSLCTNAVIVN